MRRKGPNAFIIFLIVAVFITATPFSYAHWNALKGSNNTSTIGGITIGDYAADAFDRLPSGTPQYIVDQLNELKASDPQGLEHIVDAIAGILEALPDYKHQEGKIVVGSDISDLFGDGKNITNDGLLVYLVDGDNGKEVILVHISPQSNFNISGPADLEYALERPWTGINHLSSVWLRGNLYTTRNSSVEYSGKFYLMNYDGPSGTPPSQDLGTWFEISENYEYLSHNSVHWKNYIVRQNGAYYIANQAIFGHSPSNAPWGWTEVPLYQNQSLSINAVVYTQNGGEISFWRKISTAQGIAPSPTSARNGHWRQINNGWIGRNGDADIKSYYFEHNTYGIHDVVICGVSPKLQYKYFQAIKNVPADQPPLVRDSNGILQLNTEYWAVY